MTKGDGMTEGPNEVPDAEWVGRLDRAAERTRDRLIERAQSESQPQLEQASAKHWEQLMQGDSTQASGTAAAQARRPWGLALAAALVLLVCGGWWLTGRGQELGTGTTPDAQPVVLDSGPGLQLLGPTGDVEEFARFHWESKLAPGGWYELSIWDANQEGGKPLMQTEVDEREWVPDASWTDPEAIRWQVRAFTADGTLDAVVEAQATRVPQ